MSATNLLINIASQFTGKKSFADAEKATKKLTGSVKMLGRTLGVTLSAAAVLAYGKASVKAAGEDIKAQKLLANSLKNVGLAYASVDVEGFISKMQSQTGVLDDFLRPAFAKLAQVTGSVAKTESLMALAFDVSSGSGLDYASTVDILSQAYVGNVKGLKQLNLGLTQAEIKAMSFDEIVTLLNSRFAGSGAAALDTYIGQMDLLKAAASQATEIIGTSLIGAIDSLGGNGGIASVGTDIENAAKSLANFIDSVVYLKEQIASIPGAHYFGNVVNFVTDVLGGFSPQHAAELLKQAKGPQPFTQPMTIANQDTGRAAAAAQKKAELDAIKRNKELAALAKSQANSAALAAKAKRDQALLDKAALALGKGQDVFNMDAIQIQAALMAKQEEINKLGVNATDQQKLQIANDLVRLTVKQDILRLEDAIANKDVEGATALAAKLNKDLAILGVLSGQQAKLVDINNILTAFKPKDLINLQNLQDALDLLAKFKFPTLTLPSGQVIGGTTSGSSGGSSGSSNNGTTGSNGGGTTTDSQAWAKEIADKIAADAAAIAQVTLTDKIAQASFTQGVTAGLSIAGSLSGARYAAQGAASMGGGVVNVTVNAGAVGSEQDLVYFIQDAIQKLNRGGDPLSTAGVL
jgi:hypothetical protein